MIGAQSAVRGIHIGETVREAFDNLRVQGRRSALALLGILIGTASIIAMLNIGHIAQLETLKLFRRMGADMLQLQSSPTGSTPTAAFDRAVLEQLPPRDPDILTVTPLATGRAPIVAGMRQADIAIAGITPALTDLLELPLARGRAIGRIDDCALVVVAGADVASQLSAPGAQVVPGAKLGIGDYIFTVVGVLGQTQPEPLSSVDYNNSLLIPLACSGRVLPASGPNIALVRLRPGADIEAAGQRLSAMLADPALTIQVGSARQVIETMNQQKLVNSRMLTAIGSISLLVGGIGVMNVMLMNVMERRREIGLRAAIGATPSDLQTMFLVEAGVLALVGGVGGTIFGVLAAFVVAQASGWTFSLALDVLPLGPGMAVLVGLVFGLYPAFAAARLRPIEALRAD
ncbi:ABC transporter permease [Sphingomonas sp. KC8]|uniref:ABC transporter permease n=1 Tax=Sphingomonas sp. KC8 TaxID=1030157 RepID=UPI0002488B29|nr:ABC transporter permease [Sphingomonas sp. KC8]ARS29263.1 hypothetical protein KC8_18480 [Sphingomonas sp. KC8]